ncbi:unnamed protein product, partial [Meganyctiphanes norvegica]
RHLILPTALALMMAVMQATETVAQQDPGCEGVLHCPRDSSCSCNPCEGIERSSQYGIRPPRNAPYLTCSGNRVCLCPNSQCSRIRGGGGKQVSGRHDDE